MSNRKKCRYIGKSCPMPHKMEIQLFHGGKNSIRLGKLEHTTRFFIIDDYRVCSLVSQVFRSHKNRTTHNILWIDGNGMKVLMYWYWMKWQPQIQQTLTISSCSRQTAGAFLRLTWLTSKERILIKKKWKAKLVSFRLSAVKLFCSSKLKLVIEIPLPLTSRHFLQNVCWHGNTLEEVSNRSRQTEHSKIKFRVYSSILYISSFNSDSLEALLYSQFFLSKILSIILIASATPTFFQYVLDFC